MLISLLELVIVLGLLYWIITLIPLPPPFKQVALVVLCVIALFWVLEMFGGIGLGYHGTGCRGLLC